VAGRFSATAPAGQGSRRAAIRQQLGERTCTMATVFTYFAVAVACGVFAVYLLVWFNTRKG
jgi:cell division protein FtsX